MIKKMMQSRGVRKLFRDKLALVSMAIIACYVVIAVFTSLGGITLEDTQQRVMDKNQPGFGFRTNLEARADSAKRFMERVDSETALMPETIEARKRAFAKLAMSERVVAGKYTSPETIAESDEAVADIRSMIEEFDVIFESLQEANGEMVFEDQLSKKRFSIEGDVVRYRIAIEGEGFGDEMSLAEIQGRTEKVEQLEAIVDTILPMPNSLRYSVSTMLGSDGSGQSIAMRALYSTKVAFQIGLVTAIISVLLGTVLGAAAAFYGGWVDQVVMWLVSTLSSIPYLVMLAVLVVAFKGTIFDDVNKPLLALIPVYAAFCLTFWIGTCRVIRGEVLKIKELEYVQAATAIGFGKLYILLKHVIPNTTHLMFINFSLGFIGAIKSEVILSFLGLGVKGQPSWGVMINHSKDDMQNGFFWQLGAASVLMFGLVLSFNVLSDALQDAFDPKHVS